MKFQYLAVIFVIIMLPIVLVLSFYTQTQIDIINKQSSYTSMLNSATYAAVKAFQINTTNSYYSSVSDSKIRDIEASVNTFYNSLTESLDYTKEELQPFTPAIVYTLYDGYYIYGKRYNVLKNSDVTKDAGEATGYDIKIVDETGTGTDPDRYEYGLKPFVYYSCRYTKDTDNDFVVNFTLDNFISIYGTVGGEYVNRSGYLISTKSSDWDFGAGLNKTEDAGERLTNFNSYKGAEVENEEVLSEYLRFNESGYTDKTYNYVIYKNQKIYIDGEGTNARYFSYNQGKANIINSSEIINEVKDKKTTSAKEYYIKAYNFSDWITEKLGDVKQENISYIKINDDGSTSIKMGGENLEFNAGDSYIFKMNEANNDPEDPASTFNQHRIAVIKNSIVTNLIAAINSYNSFANSVEYALPRLQEEDWEKVVNNVCVISFMQGLPTGGKYFNNYSVIPNDINNEFVDDDAIYILTEDGQYHLPNCELLVDDVTYQGKILGGYLNTSFAQQTIKIGSDERHYYKHIHGSGANPPPYTGCYHCIVNGTSKYELQDIINAEIRSGESYIKGTNYKITDLRSKYLTVLAREKYNLYKTNN